MVDEYLYYMQGTEESQDEVQSEETEEPVEDVDVESDEDETETEEDVKTE